MVSEKRGIFHFTSSNADKNVCAFQLAIGKDNNIYQVNVSPKEFTKCSFSKFMYNSDSSFCRKD